MTVQEFVQAVTFYLLAKLVQRPVSPNTSMKSIIEAQKVDIDKFNAVCQAGEEWFHIAQWCDWKLGLGQKPDWA